MTGLPKSFKSIPCSEAPFQSAGNIPALSLLQEDGVGFHRGEFGWILPCDVAQKHHPLVGCLVVPLGWHCGIPPLWCSHITPLSHTSHGHAEVGQAETFPQLRVLTNYFRKRKLIPWVFSFWDGCGVKASNQQDLVGSKGILEALDMAGIRSNN